MASNHFTYLCLLCSITLLFSINGAQSQLSTTFYAQSCPNLQTIVRSEMAKIVSQQPRLAASVLQLFFHDCFVTGCDASVLLDDTANFTGEKTAIANQRIRGYGVIDIIKARVESACRATVSCADILALATRDGVNLLGGPTWQVPLGRRDSRIASLTEANNLPSPFESLQQIIRKFAAKGLSVTDMTALSGAHTIGDAHCRSFRGRLISDSNIEAGFKALRIQTCPVSGGNDFVLAPLDHTSPSRFDNTYFKNLVAKQGLLHSDQELFNGGSTDALVLRYSSDENTFARDFVAAMLRMGNISPLTGGNGEIRLHCRRRN